MNQQPELCFCESVTDLLQDEVQVDALLPVDVGVTEAGQLLGVSPVNLHLHLKHSPHAPSEPAAGQPDPGDFLSQQRDVRRSAETQRTSCFYSDNIQTKLNMQPLCTTCSAHDDDSSSIQTSCLKNPERHSVVNILENDSHRVH